MMTEKGKGLILTKIRKIRLVKADLQFIIRIFFRYRKGTKIENNNYVSKSNFRIRNNYCIKNVLLEKEFFKIIEYIVENHQFIS